MNKAELSPANKLASNKYFLIALGLLNALAFTLLLCGLSLLAGLTISKWQFPLACFLALIVNYFAAKFCMGEKANSSFLKNSVVIVGWIIGLILCCGYFYDVSYDGQWYHQETVLQLKNGYNPVYQNLPVPADELANTNTALWCSGPDPIANYVKPDKPVVNIKFLAVNYFSKGSEIIEAAIYKMTNRIETGKAVNGMMIMASFFLCLSLLYKIDRIGKYKKWLLAILLSFNPIAVTQLLGFCVDGNMACLLLCLLVISCLLFIEMNTYYLFLLGSIIIMLVNIKFTSLIFTGIYGIALVVVLLAYKKIAVLKKVLIAGIFSAVVGIVCCGFNPYITNVIKKHNVFYGSDDVRAVTETLEPALFRNHNSIETFILSLSAHQGWNSANKKTVWQIPKIPFTFNKEDILDAKDGQQELSAFGPFFSGALLISIAIFILAFIKFRATRAFKYAAGAILVTLFTVLITPYSWWARYVPQFWLIPVIILSLSEILFINSKKVIKNLLYVALGLNVAWALLSIVFNVFSTARINYQMEQLKALNKPIIIEYCMYESFKSNQARFDEWGIPYIEKNVTGTHVYNVEGGSSTRFETPVELPQLPKPFLMRLSQHLQGNK